MRKGDWILRDRKNQKCLGTYPSLHHAVEAMRVDAKRYIPFSSWEEAGTNKEANDYYIYCDAEGGWDYYIVKF